MVQTLERHYIFFEMAQNTDSTMNGLIIPSPDAVSKNTMLGYKPDSGPKGITMWQKPHERLYQVFRNLPVRGRFET